jgi:hypothetical protein
MSWHARSIATTLSLLRGETDPDTDELEPEATSAGSGSGSMEEEEGESSPRGCSPNRGRHGAEEPGTPSRDVKDDISELTETLTRCLCPRRRRRPPGRKGLKRPAQKLLRAS